MAPVRAVETAEVGAGADAAVGIGARPQRDNRPDFGGLAVWVDAVPEIGIDAEAFGFDEGDAWVCDVSQHSDDARSVPFTVDVGSPEYSKVWRPLPGTGREPRPGLLLSVVRAGVVLACPTPLPDPPTGALARALTRLEPAQSAGPRLLPVATAPQPCHTAAPRTYADVRALVGIVVEILVGRRAATHAARFTDPQVRGKLRKPQYPRTAALKSVRLAESGEGIEATALLHDRGRTRVVALRFDRAEDERWRCTALHIG